MQAAAETAVERHGRGDRLTLRKVVEGGFAAGFGGPVAEVFEDGGALVEGELAACGGEVAEEVVAAGLGDEGGVADVRAPGGQRHDLGEDAPLVATPRAQPRAELV